MTIRTERLELRPFVAEDMLWFKEIAKNEEIQMLLPSVACGEDDIIKEYIAIYSKGDFINDFYFVICDNNKKTLGIIIANRVGDVTIDFLYFLKQDSRHRGYMHEALGGFIKFARTVQPLYKFRFVVASYNIASLNVVKSLDATIEKVFGHYICYL